MQGTRFTPMIAVVVSLVFVGSTPVLAVDEGLDQGASEDGRAQQPSAEVADQSEFQTQTRQFIEQYRQRILWVPRERVSPEAQRQLSWVDLSLNHVERANETVEDLPAEQRQERVAEIGQWAQHIQEYWGRLQAQLADVYGNAYVMSWPEVEQQARQRIEAYRSQVKAMAAEAPSRLNWQMERLQTSINTAEERVDQFDDSLPIEKQVDHKMWVAERLVDVERRVEQRRYQLAEATGGSPDQAVEADDGELRGWVLSDMDWSAYKDTADQFIGRYREAIEVVENREEPDEDAAGLAEGLDGLIGDIEELVERVENPTPNEVQSLGEDVDERFDSLSSKLTERLSRAHRQWRKLHEQGANQFERLGKKHADMPWEEFERRSQEIVELYRQRIESLPADDLDPVAVREIAQIQVGLHGVERQLDGVDEPSAEEQRQQKAAATAALLEVEPSWERVQRQVQGT